jgi:hypothetical protein
MVHSVSAEYSTGSMTLRVFVWRVKKFSQTNLSPPVLTVSELRGSTMLHPEDPISVTFFTGTFSSVCQLPCLPSVAAAVQSSKQGIRFR